MKFFSFILAICFGLNTFAKILTAQEKTADFEQLLSFVNSSYAPLDFKKTVQRIPVESLTESYRAKILATETNSDFYQVMIQFVSEFHDGHFGVTIPSTYRSELPIATDLVAGKVLIGEVDRTKLFEKEFPFSKGDELVSVDGQPVLDVVAQLQKNAGSGTDLAEKRRAAQILFYRAGGKYKVPTGEVEVSVRRGQSDIIESVKLQWKVTGAPLDEKNYFYLPTTSHDELSIKKDLLETFGAQRLERSYRCSGETRIHIPTDAVSIVKKPFVAYYHPTPNGNVGYLRIPHYSWSNVVIDGVTYTPELVFEIYKYAVHKLEQNTVGLIIDQDHNCGGSVGFLESMVGLFITKPELPMQFELLATKKEYLSFKDWATQINENTIAHHNQMKVADLVKKTWEEGRKLTEKTSLFGETYILPNETRYTKPIIMLIDELSGSGGDAFPSMLGGYGRATLLGTQTAGLGGHVEELPPLNYSGLKARMTKSLFYRPDGVPVENNGAIPDIPYTITRDDYLYDYKGYQKFYLAELFKKLPEQKK